MSFFFNQTLMVSAVILMASSLTFGFSANQELFDFDWRFAAGDFPAAQNPEFDDSAWQALDLPHDFSIYGLYDETMEGGMPNGFRPLLIGWYRKHFPTPQELSKQQMWLDFEGVYRDPKVWVNGVLVAEFKNGYLGFACDITPHLKPVGQMNVVAVRADNSLPNTSRWYTGGGIYRHVWQIITGKVHVVRHGTYVTTPKITAEKAFLEVLTEVINKTDQDRWITLTSTVLDPDGISVATETSVVPIRKGETFVFRQDIEVSNPILWDLECPAMYRLLSSVNEDDRCWDRYETPFGIREMQITPDGFYLNGKRQYLKGFNIHHDNGCLGAAAFDRAIERRLEVMKEIGCNAVRLSHNPHAPALIDMCDRMGILVYDEAFDMRNGQFYGSNEAFVQCWPEDLEAFIRRDRNHPSVFVWSVGNEGNNIFVAPDYGVNVFDAMAEVVRRVDPTRPVTQALFPMRWNGARDGIRDQHPNWRDYPPHQMAFHMDVMSANYMEKHFAQDRLKYPQLSFISSESGTSGGGRGAWASMDQEHAVGLFFWGGINYLGESHWWPIRGWLSGFVDLCGFRRPVSWDVQSYFSEEPIVHLVVHDPRPKNDIVMVKDPRAESAGLSKELKVSHAFLKSHWNWQDQPKVTVEAYSNCEAVELFLNEKSLGVKVRDGQPGIGPRLTWNVDFAPGTLTAVGIRSGQACVRHELKTAGEPAQIRLISDRLQLKADGQDLSHIRVEVADERGVLVPDAAHRITFAVSGVGVNAGVDNADPLGLELMQADHRKVYDGCALLVIRTTRQSGQITINAKSDGLKPATLVLKSD